MKFIYDLHIVSDIDIIALRKLLSYWDGSLFFLFLSTYIQIWSENSMPTLIIKRAIVEKKFDLLFEVDNSSSLESQLLKF